MADSMSEARRRLIVALDTGDPAEAVDLAEGFRGHAGLVKVGMTLYYSAGPDVVRELRERGLGVFVDLKLHDIPHQVRGAAHELGRLGASMLTVHASGGRAMIEAAVQGAREGAAEVGVEPPAVLAVTVLTSLSAEALAETGVTAAPAEQVLRLATLAREAGADGVVCSPQETTAVREALGPDALVVTPGVRPTWAETGDQSRIATPLHAIAAGASHLVVGRPITSAEDPAQAADRIVEEMSQAFSEGER